MTRTGAYPPGVTQRDVDMAQPGYFDEPCPHCGAVLGPDETCVPGETCPPLDDVPDTPEWKSRRHR